MFKDNFSNQSSVYAQFRPKYPKEVYYFIFSILKNKKTAWDCATGNGQMAVELAKGFDKVFATDISENQLSKAPKIENIEYLACPAEKTPFEENSFDFISVAQAIHWFDFEKFYNEANRVSKKDAILFIIGYSTPRFEGKIDEIVQDFYLNTTGPYWDSERRHIDNHYESIPFPYKKIETPIFSMNYEWSIEMAEGYFNSWSSVQHFIKKNGYNPVENFVLELKKYWKNNEKVYFPLFAKTGKL